MSRPRLINVLVASLGACLFVKVSAATADSYGQLHDRMKDRQPQLEAILSGPSHCLGERLDGFLEINASCTETERDVAEQENADRKALHDLMAEELGTSADAIGHERASRYVDRYRPGILRQIRISANETTWWDGRPPDPRQTDVSRVLALRHAIIRAEADAASATARDNVQEYEAFGVVASKGDATGKRWYQVTNSYVPKVKPPNWAPTSIGWLSEDDIVPWRRALVMRFTNPYQRPRSLFFATPDPLLSLIRSNPETRAGQVEILRHDAERGEAEGGVIAVEPTVSQRQEQFIMYPVLDYVGRETGDQVRLDGQFTRILEVAARAGGDRTGSSPVEDVPIDLVFVMDTTNSMAPYLADVVAATRQFVQNGTDNRLRFGFVGYRDKGAEYVARELTQTTQPADEFLRTLEDVKAREKPLKGDDIPEAVFEGLDTALESSMWRRGDVIKVILLVGDAPGHDSEVQIERIRDKARTREVSLFTIHIGHSIVSKGFDDVAVDQYRRLSAVEERSGGPISFMQSVDAQGGSFRLLVRDALEDARSRLEDIRRAGGDSTKLADAEPGSLSELIFRRAAVILAKKGVPPKNVQGWVADRVLTDPGREALSPMILLSETELDELESSVRELKEIGESALRGEGGTTPDFFDLVERYSRFVVVDPTAATFRDRFTMPIGIDDLPYLSDIMSATRDEFRNTDRVQEFIRSMTNKLAHYEDLRRQIGNPNVWKKLSVGATERVVGLELDRLP